MFIHIILVMLVRSDFGDNLEHDYNVTTKLMTSWSLVVSGLGAPFALVAAFFMIATNWCRETKKLYTQLKAKVNDKREKRSRDIVMKPVRTSTATNDDDDFHTENEPIDDDRKNIVHYM